MKIYVKSNVLGSASSDDANKILQAIRAICEGDSDQKFRILDGGIIEHASYEEDLFTWAKISDMIKVIQENGLDIDDPWDVFDAFDEAQFDSTGAYPDPENMLHDLINMHKNHRILEEFGEFNVKDDMKLSDWFDY